MFALVLLMFISWQLAAQSSLVPNTIASSNSIIVAKAKSTTQNSSSARIVKASFAVKGSVKDINGNVSGVTVTEKALPTPHLLIAKETLLLK